MEGIAFIAASPLQLACLEEESVVLAYTWLDLQRTSYASGYSFFSVPSWTCPCAWQRLSSLLSLQWQDMLLGSVVIIIIVNNIRNGGCLRHHVLTLAAAIHHKQISIPLQHLGPNNNYASQIWQVVARSIFKTSKDRGCPGNLADSIDSR